MLLDLVFQGTDITWEILTLAFKMAVMSSGLSFNDLSSKLLSPGSEPNTSLIVKFSPVKMTEAYHYVLKMSARIIQTINM